MIQTDKVIFIENPGTDSDYVADILLEQCGGFRITPVETVLEEPVKSHLVFTMVRHPSERMAKLMSLYARGDANLEEFLEAEFPGFQSLPQSHWMQNCNKLIRYEDMPQALEELLLEAGYVGFDMLPWVPENKQTSDDMQKTLEKMGEDYTLWPKKRGRPPKKDLTIPVETV